MFAKYDEVYTKQTFSGKGKSVAEADEARDEAFVSIKNFLWGYQQVFQYYDGASNPNFQLTTRTDFSIFINRFN